MAPLASPLRAFPSATRRRARRATRAAAESDKGGWFRPLEGLAQRIGVTIYTVRAIPRRRAHRPDIPSSAPPPRLRPALRLHPPPLTLTPSSTSLFRPKGPAPPPVTPGARVDFLESMLQWHLGNSTSTDLVLREVQDAIVQEVTSFPVEKVALGDSPSVAMHVPISLLRAAPAGDPATVADMGAASVALSGRAAVEALPILRSADGDALLTSFPAWDGWTRPSVALTLRAVLMTSSALAAAAGCNSP